MTYTKNGIEYTKPKVFLLQETGIGTAEYSARTAYNSFDQSEHQAIKYLNIDNEAEEYKMVVNNIEHSDLLDQLAWVHFHHSVLEHSVLTYLIKGTSRGVLQELSRHRIASPTVQSTRYTMSSIINAFVAEIITRKNPNTIPTDEFINKMLELDIFVTTDIEYNTLQINDIFNKLLYQYNKLGHEEFMETAVSKSSLDIINNNQLKYPDMFYFESVFNALESGKKKRNVGDAFKGIVNDLWKVDLVYTINLRSLKNFLTLRDSGSAYFQIQVLAQEMKKVTPKKYLDLIVKQ